MSSKGKSGGKRKAAAPATSPAKKGSKKGADQGTRPGHEVFTEQLESRAAELGMTYAMLGGLEPESDDEYDDETGPTLAMLQPLKRVFLAKKFDEFFNKLSKSLQQIGCTPPGSEDEDEEAAGMGAMMASMPESMRFMFRMLNMRHSYPMQELLKAELAEVDKLIKAGKWEDAFARWFATVMAARQEEHWYGDTDMPEVVTSICKKIKSQWTKIKAQSDKDLGDPSVEGEGAGPVKQEVTAYMNSLMKDVKDVGHKA